MRKNYFLILLPFLFVLVFTGCTKKMADEVINSIPFLGGDEEINKAVEKKDMNLCKKLTGKDALAQLRRQNRCVEKVAMALENYQGCFLIMSVDDPDEIDGQAAGACATEIAVETADLSVCDGIKGTSYDVTKCYARLAPVLKDASICAKVGEGTAWNNCIKNTAKAAEKIEICDNFEVSSTKGSCQSAVAVIKQDASLCARIEQENYKNNCYKNIAIKTKDAGLCDNLSTDERKEQCRKNIEATKPL